MWTLRRRDRSVDSGLFAHTWAKLARSAARSPHIERHHSIRFFEFGKYGTIPAKQIAAEIRLN
jgi:hypothetical protein